MRGMQEPWRGMSTELRGFQLGGTGVVTIRERKAGKMGMKGEQS